MDKFQGQNNANEDDALVQKYLISLEKHLSKKENKLREAIEVAKKPVDIVGKTWGC